MKTYIQKLTKLKKDSIKLIKSKAKLHIITLPLYTIELIEGIYTVTNKYNGYVFDLDQSKLDINVLCDIADHINYLYSI